ncbi:MAG: hypothetical protein ACYC5M_13190 [Anaerolineae bacterium]
MLTGALESQYSESLQIVRQRLLSTPGQVLVAVGDRVGPSEIVAQGSAEGRLLTIDISAGLGISAGAVSRHLRVVEGQTVAEGDVLAARRSWLRWRLVTSPYAGRVQGLAAGGLFLRQEVPPEQVRAYIPGQVTEQVPELGVSVCTTGALIRGIWGSGAASHGMLVSGAEEPDTLLTWQRVKRRHRGIVLFGGPLSDPTALYRAKHFGLRGLIVASLAPGLCALCAQLALPLVVVEGLGHLPMSWPILELLQAHSGKYAVLSGGALSHGRPEIILPAPSEIPSLAPMVARHLQLGAKVRLTRHPHAGVTAQVVAIPTTPQETALGTRVPGVEVRLPNGQRVFVPVANLELLG